ncbi:MAG: hypothetical protein ABH873_05320 [Candidatus Firestonebacteria bacterium]
MLFLWEKMKIIKHCKTLMSSFIFMFFSGVISASSIIWIETNSDIKAIDVNKMEIIKNPPNFYRPISFQDCKYLVLFGIKNIQENTFLLVKSHKYYYNNN